MQAGTQAGAPKAILQGAGGVVQATGTTGSAVQVADGALQKFLTPETMSQLQASQMQALRAQMVQASSSSPSALVGGAGGAGITRAIINANTNLDDAKTTSSSDAAPRIAVNDDINNAAAGPLGHLNASTTVTTVTTVTPLTKPATTTTPATPATPASTPRASRAKVPRREPAKGADGATPRRKRRKIAAAKVDAAMVDNPADVVPSPASLAAAAVAAAATAAAAAAMLPRETSSAATTAVVEAHATVDSTIDLESSDLL